MDGSNWFHSLVEAGISDRGRLKYAKVSEKLVGPRTWEGTRYYTADVGIMSDPKLLEDQRKFLANIQAEDRRITVHLGRLEARPPDIRSGKVLLDYLAKVPERGFQIPKEVYHELIALGKNLKTRPVFVEKAVDVQIAVDMVRMAWEDEYETAYLLSADGDFTPVVEAVRTRGKRIFTVSPSVSYKLGQAAHKHLHLKSDFFKSCY